jgi:rod shape-determining protein MreC
LALLLMVADARFQMVQPLRASIATALYPLQWLVLQPLVLSQHVSARMGGMFSNETTLQQLRTQLAEQRQRAQQTEQLALENQRLRGILNLQERQWPGTLAAQVVYDAADPYTRKVVLDKGQSQGVQLASPVIDEFGVIGQVTRVFPLSSEVTLITDRDHAIPVVNVRTGARGVAYGETARNADALELRFMAANADVAVGDMLTTSGVDGVYPAGLPVARVDKVERRTEAVFARIECVPIAMVAGTRQVLVLLPTAQAAVARPPPEPERKPVRSGGRR